MTLDELRERLSALDRQLLALVAERQELSRQVGLSAGTISHHMACLVREGFVAMSKRGSRVTYELRRGKLEELLDALRASLI